MYYSSLKRAIQDIEEKKFYDISLLFLRSEGYKDISIIDGTGDGGRDVSCSRSDLRIQLSIRKDWENKINYEAAFALKAGKRHLIYITNRLIRDVDLMNFRKGNYKLKGEVEVSVFDLNRICTSLSGPGIIKKTYETLGYLVQGKINATPKEIALSNTLLFSGEIKNLRNNIIESNIRAYIYKNPLSIDKVVISSVASCLPGVDIEHDSKSALSRLVSRGDVIQKDKQVTLSFSMNKVKTTGFQPVSFSNLI